MKVRFLPFIGICLFLLLWSCKTEKPTVTEDQYHPQIFMSAPTKVPFGQYTYVTQNQAIELDIRFEDDVELDRFELTIRRKDTLDYLRVENDFWEETILGRLSGSSDGINYPIYVDNDPSAGPHLFKIQVWDKTGKMSEDSTFFFVKNTRDDQAPIIRFSTPDTIFTDTSFVGDDVHLEGFISDNSIVIDAFFRIIDLNTEKVMMERDIILDTLFTSYYPLDTFFNFDSVEVLPAGFYLIEGFAKDNFFNVGKIEDSIFVKPI